jgi:hypothetical protein
MIRFRHPSTFILTAYFNNTDPLTTKRRKIYLTGNIKEKYCSKKYFTFSTTEGNLAGELTTAKNPSKSSAAMMVVFTGTLVNILPRSRLYLGIQNWRRQLPLSNLHVIRRWDS